VLNDFETNEFAGIVCLLIDMDDDESEYGRELFESDGTESGTLRVKDLYKGKVSSNPTNLVSLFNYIYFSARNQLVGRELFRLDLETRRVELVEDIRRGYASSNPQDLCTLQSHQRVLFSATDDRGDEELWVTSLDEQETLRWNDLESDTSRHTRRVQDICTTSCSSSPRNLVNLGDSYVYFSALHDVYGRELFRSNGTNVELVEDIRPGHGSSSPHMLTVFQNKLFFAADDGITGVEIYRYSNYVTTRLEIRAGSRSSFPAHLTSFFVGASRQIGFQSLYLMANNRLFRTRSNDTSVIEAAFQRTQPLIEINPSVNEKRCANMLSFSGTLIMSARRAERPIEASPMSPPRTRSVAVYDDDTNGEMEVLLSSRLGKVFIRMYTDAYITVMEGSYNEASPVIRFRGTLFDVNRALRSVSFEAQTDETGEDDVLIEVTDSDGATTLETVNLWIRPINDPPVISMSSSSVSVAKGQMLEIFGTSISDVDLNDEHERLSRDVRVECFVAKGRIGLNSLSGLNLLQGNGEDLSRSILFEGNLKSTNDALYRIRYICDDNVDDCNEEDEDTFTIRVNDLGSHGEGGEMVTEHVMRILIDR